MDISIALNGTRLNARVAVLLKSPTGYIFEKDKSGYLFAVGGRIKINEDSESAARREAKEEIGIDLNSIRLIGIIENFFNHADEPFHEICFLYKAELAEEPKLPDGFYFILLQELSDHDIRPVILREFAESDSNEILHRLVRN